MAAKYLKLLIQNRQAPDSAEYSIRKYGCYTWKIAGKRFDLVNSPGYVPHYIIIQSTAR